MKNYLFLLTLILLVGCKKEVIPLKEIVVGDIEPNAITTDFSPLKIGYYYNQFSWATIHIDGIGYLKFRRYIYVNKINYESFSSQLVYTTGDCEICTRDSVPAVFSRNDKILVSDTFMKFNGADIQTKVGNDNYIVFRFGKDKRYIGWLNMNETFDELEFVNCSYYLIQ